MLIRKLDVEGNDWGNAIVSGTDLGAYIMEKRGDEDAFYSDSEVDLDDFVQQANLRNDVPTENKKDRFQVQLDAQRLPAAVFYAKNSETMLRGLNVIAKLAGQQNIKTQNGTLTILSGPYSNHLLTTGQKLKGGMRWLIGRTALGRHKGAEARQLINRATVYDHGYALAVGLARGRVGQGKGGVRLINAPEVSYDMLARYVRSMRD